MNAQASKSINETSSNGKGYADKSAQAAESVYDSAKATFADAGKKIVDGYDTVRGEVTKASSQLEGLVKKNPLISVACAAGAGWLVGRMLTSRTKSV